MKAKINSVETRLQNEWYCDYTRTLIICLKVVDGKPDNEKAR